MQGALEFKHILQWQNIKVCLSWTENNVKVVLCTRDCSISIYLSGKGLLNSVKFHIVHRLTLFPSFFLGNDQCTPAVDHKFLSRYFGSGWVRSNRGDLTSWKDPGPRARESKCPETYYERWFWNPKAQDNQIQYKISGLTWEQLSCLNSGPSWSSPWVATGLHTRWLILWARISLKDKIPYLRLKHLCSRWRDTQ